MMIRGRSRSSRRIVPTKGSAIAFARGARTGVLMILTSMAVKTASKAAVNLLSRVADEEPEAAVGVIEVHQQIACDLVSQAPVGWAVTPRMCTRRLACSMTKNA